MFLNHSTWYALYTILQISDMKKGVEALTIEVDGLEQCNIEILEGVNIDQAVGMEKTRQVYLASIGRSPGRQREKLAGAQDGSHLPSLVDMAKCTSEHVRKHLSGCVTCKVQHYTLL